MCEAISFADGDRDISIYFASQRAVLPVLKKNGQICWLPWGRHQYQAGNLPLGGWAKLDRIISGKWEAYFPKAVKIPVQAFMEKDFEGRNCWYPIIKGQVLQGVVARYDREQRVYIVTIEPEREDAIYTRWPRIVTLS